MANENTERRPQREAPKPKEEAPQVSEEFAEGRLVRERLPIADPRMPNAIPIRAGYKRENVGDVRGWVQAKVWDGWTFVTWEQLEREYHTKFPVIGEEDPRDRPYERGAIRRRGGRAAGFPDHWVYLMEIPQERYDALLKERMPERLAPLRELYRNVNKEKAQSTAYGPGLQGGAPKAVVKQILEQIDEE